MFSSLRNATKSTSPLDEPLLDGSEDKPLDLFSQTQAHCNVQLDPLEPSKPSPRPLLHLLASLAINTVLFVIVIYAAVQRSMMVRWEGAPQVYSPVLDSLTHNHVVFTPLLTRTKWHGPPNDAVDKEWEALYDIGISAISGAQAALLPNKTTNLAGLDDKYIISLDVFHQLHCLNTLRKFQHPKRYPRVVEQRYRDEPGYGKIDHINHCIQAIREALMCYADRTLDPFLEPNDRDHSQVSFESYHTCRDFGAIQKWAQEHQSPFKFSDVVMAHGALVPANLG